VARRLRPPATVEHTREGHTPTLNQGRTTEAAKGAVDGSPPVAVRLAVGKASRRRGKAVVNSLRIVGWHHQKLLVVDIVTVVVKVAQGLHKSGLVDFHGWTGWTGGAPASIGLSIGGCHERGTFSLACGIVSCG